MKKTFFIGIDPGKAGGMAVVDDGGMAVDVAAMPDTPYDLYMLLKEYADGAAIKGASVVCCLEKVGGMPGQGGSSMFTFGRSYGWLEMALLSLGITTSVVTPQKWQRYYQVGASSITRSSAAEKREHKNKLKQRAQQLFPYLGKKITLKTCDALLIAEYCRHSEKKGGGDE